MHKSSVLPFGKWASPITAYQVAQCDAPVEWAGFYGSDPCWIESRPAEAGRRALVRSHEGKSGDIRWESSVQSKVIGYGGVPWAPVSRSDTDGLLIVDGVDQRVYLLRPGNDRVALTPEAIEGEYRYSEFSVTNHQIWCLRETVLDEAGQNVQRHIVSFPISGAAASDGSLVRVRAASHDFMTGPKISDDGRRVAWIGWNHPAMPWDRTEVMIAEIPQGDESLSAMCVAGKDAESITQLEWSTSDRGALLVVTDRSGWWNIDQINEDGTRQNLHAAAEEFADALWRIGQRWFVPLDNGSIAVVHGRNTRRLGILDIYGHLTDLDTPFTEWFSISTDGRKIVAVAASPVHRRTVITVDPETNTWETIRPGISSNDEYTSVPELRVWRHVDGREVHAHQYRPYSPIFTAPSGQKPPYIVVAHGGPTSRSQAIRSQEFSYFTSRGIGVIDVQYGGSTGFGREFRMLLQQNWGVIDVMDVEFVAHKLLEEGEAGKLAIRGGSAGGWTAACAIGKESGRFAAAAIYYPVISPELWYENGTHDFESRYLDSLLGPWPEQREVYRQRSPLSSASSIRVPFALFQGEEDTVCPPEQARALIDAVGSVGDEKVRIRNTYKTIAGEGHGFVKIETLESCLEAELSLFQSALVESSSECSGMPETESSSPDLTRHSNVRDGRKGADTNGY
ncbi:alpha/beta hydrolase family protein [Psychromicrobium lacuslunae]|uniref:alpha/beta hydrolase family protein n=1 Tax=Psychromicrobium lacuslunae TaxID=1618207 RepID=UPI000AA01054|nr:prolyl oligopeptidase family serine peptidase [Psychromicrobium lacuslunae]